MKSYHAGSEASAPQTLMTGLAFGESPRWHDGRLWFSNWTAQEIRSLRVVFDPRPILEAAGKKAARPD